MPDYALDAAQMFRAMREKMNRDPAKVKQTWVFKWTVKNAISTDHVDQVLGPIMRRFERVFGNRLPEIEVHFDENENGEIEQSRLLMYSKTVIPEKGLAFLHHQFQASAPKMRLNYAGVSFFLKDPGFDAAELFAYEKAFNNRDLARHQSPWKFCFSGSPRDPEGSAQAILVAFAELADADPDDIEACLGSTGEGEIGAEIVYYGCFTEAGLRQLHKKLKKAGKKNRFTYDGVSIDSPRNVSVDSASNDSVTPLTIADGIAWTDKVLNVSGKFKIEKLPGIADKMRKFHLKKLTEVGMVAADWMPVADARLDCQLRPKAEVVRRLMGAFAATAWVCAPPEAVTSKEIKYYLSANKLGRKSFSDRETNWLQTSRSEVAEFAPLAGWGYENIWSLAWLLGYPLTPNISGEQVGPVIIGPIRDNILNEFDRTFDELMAKTKLRRLESVIALEDLMYCAHNSVRTSNIGHGGLMHERRLPLTWSLSPGVLWDDTDVST